MVDKNENENKNNVNEAKVERSSNEPKDINKLVIISDSREGLSMNLIKLFNEKKHPVIAFTTDDEKYAEANVDGIAFTPTESDSKANGIKYPELLMYIKVTDFVNEMDQSLELIKATEETYGPFDSFINTSTVVTNKQIDELQLGQSTPGDPVAAAKQLAFLRSSMGSLQLMARLLGTETNVPGQPLQPDMTKYRNKALVNASASKRSEASDADPRNMTISSMRATDDYTAEVVSMQQILPEKEWPDQFQDKDKGYDAEQVAQMIYLVSQMPASDTSRMIKTIYNI